MADSFWTYMRCNPSIEYCHLQLEKKIKQHDKIVKHCSMVLGVILVMFVAGSAIMRVSSVQYNSTWQQQALTPPPNGTRAHRRTFSRVTATMRGECTDNDVVFGPQITVQGEAYAHAIAVLCERDIILCSPQVVSHGTQKISCMDEHNSEPKLKKRFAPVTINSTCGQNLNFSTYKDACVAWHVVDMLNAQW